MAFPANHYPVTIPQSLAEESADAYARRRACAPGARLSGRRDTGRLVR